jgi:hypothetical protein
MQSGHGCTTLFSDDLVLDGVTIKGNQGNGFYAQGIDSNAGSMINSSYYYNVLWGVEDQAALGNNWFGNQLSNNGSVGNLDYSDNEEHHTIARTLGPADSVVSVVLASADTNLKLGSCVVIAGVTDATFNTPQASVSSSPATPIQPTSATSSPERRRMHQLRRNVAHGEILRSLPECWSGFRVRRKSERRFRPTRSRGLVTYVEGGQDCKFGSADDGVRRSQHAACATLNTFKPATMLSVTPGIVGSSLQFGGFANEKDQNNSVYFKAGMSGRNDGIHSFAGSTTILSRFLGMDLTHREHRELLVLCDIRAAERLVLGSDA